MTATNSRRAITAVPSFSLGVAALGFFIPLVPRPTFSGAVLIAPAVAVALFLLTYIRVVSAMRHGLRPVMPGLALGVSMFVVALYAGRVVWLGETLEVPFAISRILMLLLIVVVYVLFQTMSAEDFWRPYILGALVLSVVALVIGITGVGWLEPARPPRTLGIPFPVHKTAGVPRSYGEQGVIVSILVAFAFAYVRSSGRSVAVARLCVPAAMVLLVVGQSRNMFLAACVTVLAALLIRHRRWVILHLVWIGSLLSTLVMEMLLPALMATSIGRGLVGEGVFERNVFTRFLLIDHVGEFVNRDWVRGVFLGFTHDDWLQQNYGWRVGGPVDQETGIHNHFAADLAFHGLLPGVVLVLAMFAIPMWRLIQRQRRSGAVTRESQFVVAAMVGTLSSLNYYEGFFSLSVALLVGHLWLTADGRSHTGVEGRRNACRQGLNEKVSR